jgi:hypothetical protein
MTLKIYFLDSSQKKKVLLEVSGSVLFLARLCLYLISKLSLSNNSLSQKKEKTFTTTTT